MKKKYLIVGILLALLITGVASIPRITSQTQVSFDAVMDGKYPQLLEEYQLQCDGRTLIPVEAAEVVTVSSLWGSCEYYIMPCIYSHVDTVPENGITHWSTRLCMVSACSNENNLTARLCHVGVENMNVLASCGADTILSDKADIYPQGGFDSNTGHVQIVDVPDCAVTPAVGVTFYAGTAMSAQESNAQETAYFTWDFDLVFCGRVIRSYRDITLEYDYINNA